MLRRGVQSAEVQSESWPCVSCVSDTLRSHAGMASGQELERAERRLGLRDEAGQGLIRGMARRVAERIVGPAIRGLRRASPLERPRRVAEIRKTFGLEAPDGCPLNEQVRLSTVNADCPESSSIANGRGRA